MFPLITAESSPSDAQISWRAAENSSGRAAAAPKKGSCGPAAQVRAPMPPEPGRNVLRYHRPTPLIIRGSIPLISRAGDGLMCSMPNTGCEKR